MQERLYCHGGEDPDTRRPDEGCAVAWRVWGGVGYYVEEGDLQAEGKPAPAHWSREDWRTFVRIKRLVEKIRVERIKKKGAGQWPTEP